MLSFISTIPIPRSPAWNDNTLKYFCPMLAVCALIFGLIWSSLWYAISLLPKVSVTLRCFIFMLFTLALTGGLHLDGLMDTCDAIFSHQDRHTRLEILSDTHTGSFAVMGCVVVLMAKTLLFTELSSLSPSRIFFVPAYSRLGMALMLNTLPFAKTHGLAATLGAFRTPRNNIFFAAIAVVLLVSGGWVIAATFWVCLVFWSNLCVRMFGGITGDLLGAFVELSEVVMLGVMAFCT